MLLIIDLESWVINEEDHLLFLIESDGGFYTSLMKIGKNYICILHRISIILNQEFYNPDCSSISLLLTEEEFEFLNSQVKEANNIGKKTTCCVYKNRLYTDEKLNEIIDHYAEKIQDGKII